MAKIQILMAVYNGSEFLARQLESILGQSFADWELLISDDCSTDNSLEIIKSYCKRDHRIRLILDGFHFGNAKSHFMALFREASAPYVMTCDQDDVWNLDKIEVTLDAMMQHEIAGVPLLVCTDLCVVDKSLNVISPSMLSYSGMDADQTHFGYFLASCLVTGCTMMVNDSLLKLLQMPVEVDQIIMHDWWASLVASAFGKVVYLKQATIQYRQHGENSVGAFHIRLLNLFSVFKQKCEIEKASLRQAREFKRLFGGSISNEFKSQLNSFLTVEDSGPIKKLAMLTKAKIWRSSIFKNIGTYFAFLFM